MNYNEMKNINVFLIAYSYFYMMMIHMINIHLIIFIHNFPTVGLKLLINLVQVSSCLHMLVVKVLSLISVFLQISDRNINFLHSSHSCSISQLRH